MKSTARWTDPLKAQGAKRLAARARSAHAGRCNWNLLMARGAVTNLKHLVLVLGLPKWLISALYRILHIIERRVKELRAAGPVEVAHRSTTPTGDTVP